MNPGLIVGIGGARLSDADRRLLAHPGVVGVILFTRNYRDPGQLAELTGAIRSLRAPRLLLCVDQEGGRVQRFRHGFTRLPPLGRIGRWYAKHPDRALDLAYRHGRVMAAELLGHGVDVSLAPVLDLDCGSQVIGDRAFSYDPGAVCALAAHYLAGMRDAGMKSCGKHFPGHGTVDEDSHHQIVQDQREFTSLQRDIAPFAELAGELDAVMPAHVCYPSVDSGPAGFSRRWIQDILRAELGFSGVVISDDLDMNGASAAGDLADRYAAAAGAGCDLVLVCRPESATVMTAALEPDPERYRDAAAAAQRLFGRAMFPLQDQLRVPEFRAWRDTFEQMMGKESD